MLAFNKERNRFIIKWTEHGRRKSETLWKSATQEEAEKYHAEFMGHLADPLAGLRERLQKAISRPECHGYIYAVRNPLLPGMYKIGKTSGNILVRLAAFNTAHPVDWEVERSARVTHMSEFEAILHDHFYEHRVNPKREFFTMATEKLHAAFDLCVALGDAEITAKNMARLSITSIPI